MKQRYLAQFLLAALLLLLTVAPSLAQGSLVFEDETGNLDCEEIAEAAQPLLDLGAAVAVYMVSEGSSNDLNQRLEADGLARSDGAIRNELVAIYVGLDNRYSELRAGDDWRSTLGANNTIENIRNNQLNSNLANNNYTQGYVNTLQAIESSISNPQQPAGAAGSGTTVNFNFWPIVVGAFALLGLIVGGRAIGKQRTASRALNAARSEMEEARRKAGSAIADLGGALRNAQEKAEFDRVSYAAEDVQRLAHAQNGIAARFGDLQAQFDTIGETLERQAKPTAAQYQQTAGSYTQVQEAVTALHGELEQVNAERVELDKLAQQAPGEIERARTKLTAVTKRLEAFTDEIADPVAVLAPMQQQITAAEQHQASHDARNAIAAAQTTVAEGEAIDAVLQTYGAIRDGVVQGRNDAERLTAQGYRMDTSQAALEGASAFLNEAAQALQRDGAAQAAQILQQSQARLDEAVASGRGAVELRAENERRLEQIEKLGKDIAQAIVNGAKTFDIVDEFAESTWSDIRGNGSEAEAAAGRAHEHWLNAQQKNSMELQEFAAAKEDLDAATEELAYARSLVNAISQRLKDLEEARTTARDELDAAATDIARGWEFVQSNDPDVGKAPEQKLHQAAELLERARSEQQNAKPNWLELVKHAQAANNLADEALAGARSEVEEMEKLRTKVQRAQKLASTEVQKIVQFAGVHSRDIQPDNQQEINRIQQQVQQAYTVLQEAERSEEDRRRAVLQQAYKSYTSLQTEAAEVYNEVYADFQRLDQLRTQVNEALTQARNAIVSAERTLVNYSGIAPRNSSAVRQLQTARRRFDQIKMPIVGEQNLQEALQTAQSIRRDTQEAEEEIRRYHRPGSGGGGGDLLTGMMIGSMLDSASRSERHGGWGGSGSWSGGGGGGGGWGGGFGSGGSWGGGSGSGGGW